MTTTLDKTYSVELTRAQWATVRVALLAQADYLSADPHMADLEADSIHAYNVICSATMVENL